MLDLALPFVFLRLAAAASNYAAQVASPTEYGKFVPGSVAKAARVDRLTKKERNTPEGKAAVNNSKRVLVPSRLGMVGLYAPALVVASLAVHHHQEVNGRELLISSMLGLHFGKRVLECLFLHRYSGAMPIETSVGIGAYYALMTKLVIYQQQILPMSTYYGNAGLITLKTGAALFAIGELGNLAHHALLAHGRAAAKTKGAYVVPQGGLFTLTTCPHYLFEVVAWLGIAVTASQLNAYLLALSMFSYLAGRAKAQREWYRAKFPDFPPERTCIVPFLL